MNLSSPACLGFCRAAILLSRAKPGDGRALLSYLCSGGFIPPSSFCCGRGTAALRLGRVHALTRCLVFVAAGFFPPLHFFLGGGPLRPPLAGAPPPRAPGGPQPVSFRFYILAFLVLASPRAPR